MEKEHPIESADIATKIAYIRMVAEVYSAPRAHQVAKALDLSPSLLLERHRDKIQATE